MSQGQCQRRNIVYGVLMSRIGKKPIAIPSGVKIEFAGRIIKVSGPKGSLEIKRHPAIEVKLDGDSKKIIVENYNNYWTSSNC